MNGKSPVSDLLLGLQILFSSLGITGGFYLIYKAIDEWFAREPVIRAVGIKFVLGLTLVVIDGILFLRGFISLVGS